MAHITISDNDPRVQITGTTSLGPHAFNFEIFEDADIKVYQDDTLKTLTTHYTVSGAGESGGGRHISIPTLDTLVHVGMQR